MEPETKTVTVIAAVGWLNSVAAVVSMAGETIITIVGNLVDDAKLRFTPSGAAVAKFRVASTPRTFDRQTNEWKDDESVFLIRSSEGCVRCASPTTQVQAGEKIRHVGPHCLEFIIEFIRWSRVVWAIAVPTGQPTGHHKHSGFFYKDLLLEDGEFATRWACTSRTCRRSTTRTPSSSGSSRLLRTSRTATARLTVKFDDPPFDEVHCST